MDSRMYIFSLKKYYFGNYNSHILVTESSIKIKSDKNNEHKTEIETREEGYSIKDDQLLEREWSI